MTPGRRWLWGMGVVLAAAVLWRGPELTANNVPIAARHEGRLVAPAMWVPKDLKAVNWQQAAVAAQGKDGYRDVGAEGPGVLFTARNAYWWPPIPRHPHDIPATLPLPPPTPPGMAGMALGTDALGRDLLVRMIYAVRMGIVFAMVVVSLVWVLGTVIGVSMGYLGGRYDLFMSRVVEIISLFPKFLLLLTLLALLDKPGLTTVGFVFCIAGWIPYQRYVRAEVFRERRGTYIEAARAMGAGHGRIMFLHLIPNSIRPTFVLIPFDLADTILALSGLSFLGFGTPPPTPDLGEMLDQATRNLPYGWWLAVYPGLALFGLLLAFNAVGEWVRRRQPQRRA